MLFVVRNAATLHRLLDVLPAFAGDPRITPLFTLAPGSDYDTGVLARLDREGARTVPWPPARKSYDLAISASRNGPLHELDAPLALLPHGAGFNKRVPGAADTARSCAAPDAPAPVHAIAHPYQRRHLPAASADRARVVGDPTLDRLLASRHRRDAYRDRWATGGRRLLAVTSTWGPESLLTRRPHLLERLLAELPYDGWQLALIAHPNWYADLGRLGMTRQLLVEPLRAGLVLPDPYEEWGAALVAADVVVTDHGSTALYAAALGRPLLGAYDGGAELVPDSPMAALLATVPHLEETRPYVPQLAAGAADRAAGAAERAAMAAFAERGRSLELLRGWLYELLDLRSPAPAPRPEVLPLPRAAAAQVPAFRVPTVVYGATVRLARTPDRPAPDALAPGPHAGPGAVHAAHLAAEADVAAAGDVDSAEVIFRRRRATRQPEPRQDTAWQTGAWCAHALDAHPGCRTAAVVLDRARVVLCHGGGPPLEIRIEPEAAPATAPVHWPDPAAALSAVHAWLMAGGAARPLPATLRAELGGVTVRVRIAAAGAAALAEEI
ncbi:translation initiation factor 2 [Streptomyces boninensis]|uniref:translation initiation factor 2 n=1 Tax=Streptomyces boninensis TaxID=2039455 RepID=UPI003B20BD72